MAKAKRQAKRGKIYTRLVDTGLYRTFSTYLVTEDGTEISIRKFPIQSHTLIRAGEVLPYIADEVQRALDDQSDFKGEALDAAKMLEKLKTAMAKSDVGNVLYWAYFLGRAMERHHVRQHEPNAKLGKDDRARRRKGGAATAKLTDDRKRQICELMRQENCGKVSRTAASIRVQAILAKDGLEISARRIRDIAKADWENA